MKLTLEQVQRDLDALPEKYKTADVDGVIRRYVREGTDVSELRPHILTRQQFHRIYFYVSLKQLKDAEQRMAFKIKKEEASSAGVRRIKAVLE